MREIKYGWEESSKERYLGYERNRKTRSIFLRKFEDIDSDMEKLVWNRDTLSYNNGEKGAEDLGIRTFAALSEEN